MNASTLNYLSSNATDLAPGGVEEISVALHDLLADVFALFVKTKNFHWHMHGRNFRDYHLLLDDQSEQIYAMIDPMAERARKLGGTTIRSVADIARRQRIQDSEDPSLTAEEMLTELMQNNRELTTFLRAVHGICDRHSDVATASLIENWIDETEQRSWFLREIVEG